MITVHFVIVYGNSVNGGNMHPFLHCLYYLQADQDWSTTFLSCVIGTFSPVSLPSAMLRWCSSSTQRSVSDSARCSSFASHAESALHHELDKRTTMRIFLDEGKQAHFRHAAAMVLQRSQGTCWRRLKKVRIGRKMVPLPWNMRWPKRRSK